MIRASASINAEDLKNFFTDMKEIGDLPKDANLQLHRANRYRSFTINMVQGGMLGMQNISPLTQYIAGGDHQPEWNTGSVLNYMKTKSVSAIEAQAGYFAKSDKIPGKRITFTQAVILQHTGFRIPLTGPKGQKVMKWLHGIGAFENIADTSDLSKAISALGFVVGQTVGGFLVVPPRPFMDISFERYIESGEDFKAVEEYIDGKIKKAEEYGN